MTPESAAIAGGRKFAEAQALREGDRSSLATDGSSNGLPVLKKSGGVIEFYVVRR